MTCTGIRALMAGDRGGCTIWSMTWFMLYVASGGLALDVTDADRDRLPLTFTAISTSCAGLYLPHHVYSVDCNGGNRQVGLPNAGAQPESRKVVVFSECRIHGDDTGQVEKVVLASISPDTGQRTSERGAVDRPLRRAARCDGVEARRRITGSPGSEARRAG